MGDKAYASRWTFYIGKDGKILLIDTNPTTATAGSVMVKRLQELGVARK